MSRVLLQVPDGLKRRIIEIARDLEKDGNIVVISTEPCYGACDIKDKEAFELKCDRIIHYGHTRFLETAIPVEYIELKEDIDIIPILEKEINKIEEEKIGLISSLQFVHLLEKVKDFLENKGKEVFISTEMESDKKLHPGQILGCDIGSALSINDDVDCFLMIGSGDFHSLGIALKTENPVYIMDVERGEIRKPEIENFLKEKYTAIGLAKQARVFGILVSTKAGQMNIELAEEIKKDLDSRGKEAFILVMDEIKYEKLMGLNIDCLINTACPRIAVENRKNFGVPIINVDELEESFK